MRQPLLLLACVLASCGPPSRYNGPRSKLTDAQVSTARDSCTFAKGSLPGDSVAQNATLGEDIPIDTIVILMFENRAFDHVLGDLPNAGQPNADVAATDVTNPDTQGQTVTRYHLTDMCFDDVDHSWAAQHASWDNGQNDGFVKANAGAPYDPEGKRVMGYYTASDLPLLYGLAASFATGDRYFCALLGPTFPNRLYLYAATSFGYVDNELIQVRYPNLMESLSKANVDWRVYSQTLPAPAILTETYVNFQDHFLGFQAFLDATAGGTLPAVSFVDPDLFNENGGGDDFHPPGDVQQADQFLSKVVNAVISSPQWPHLALFITYDENGGIYDHVPPPPACPPDAYPPKLYPQDPPGQFDRFGFRVPFIAVSPYARPGYVSHNVYSHTSIDRFVEARFSIPALTARDANADPLFDVFDFSKPRMLTPPSLPTTSPNSEALSACRSRYP